MCDETKMIMVTIVVILVLVIDQTEDILKPCNRGQTEIRLNYNINI